ncbi:ikzf5 [Bugula neritina]|uniref:Ikzf5 n=1 Tax=Bugula neritina TaxID=10212 RepID=A0A7J7KQ56_BUGNE|nr:ikzf5 [Bugula neritina]
MRSTELNEEPYNLSQQNVTLSPAAASENSSSICKIEPESPPASVNGQDTAREQDVSQTVSPSTSHATDKSFCKEQIHEMTRRLSPLNPPSSQSTVINNCKEASEVPVKQRKPDLDMQRLINHLRQSSANHHSTAPTPNAMTSDEDMFYFCKHCNIIFLDRAMYHLHSGLHNCNSPLQCNLCGKKCANPLEFSAHIIHT